MKNSFIPRLHQKQKPAAKAPRQKQAILTTNVMLIIMTHLFPATYKKYASHTNTNQQMMAGDGGFLAIKSHFKVAFIPHLKEAWPLLSYCTSDATVMYLVS